MGIIQDVTEDISRVIKADSCVLVGTEIILPRRTLKVLPVIMKSWERS